MAQPQTVLTHGISSYSQQSKGLVSHKVKPKNPYIGTQAESVDENVLGSMTEIFREQEGEEDEDEEEDGDEYEYDRRGQPQE